MSLPAINATIIECKDESGWLNERRKRVQASDAFDIVEGEQLKVYADKVTPVLVNNRCERFDLKLESEATVRKCYQRKYGGKVHAWPAYTIAASKEHPWLGCTPDSLVEDPTQQGVGIQQIKCWSEFDKAAWAEAPPLYVQVQTQIEMLACRVKWGAIAVMFGTNSLERFYVYPNERFLDALLPLLRDFWTCVELRQPPEPGGSALAAKALAKLHPNDSGLAVDLPAEFDQRIDRLDRLSSLRKRIEKAQSTIENQIKAAIGDNTYGVTPNGHWFSWKSQTRRAFSSPESTFRVLRECKEPKAIEYAAPKVDYKVANRVDLPQWLKVKLLNQSNRCCWCGATLTLRTATWEHRVPLSKGGTNDEHNLVLACAKCNHERGDDATLPTLVSSKG